MIKYRELLDFVIGDLHGKVPAADIKQECYKRICLALAQELTDVASKDHTSLSAALIREELLTGSSWLMYVESSVLKKVAEADNKGDRHV